MNATFLDFDGVIANSIEETFLVSVTVFYGFSGPEDTPSVRRLFFKYRGLVGPPHHFYALHSAIELVLKRNSEVYFDEFTEIFLEAVERCESCKDRFESLFFSLRQYLQSDKLKWISLNPITDFGKSLIGRELDDYYIITTKDSGSLDTLLSAYDINIKSRFTKADYEYYGSKGNIIDYVLNAAPECESAIFVDDAVEHLNSVTNPIVTCYFAPWGYGVNTGYQEFHHEIW